jgi:hypothetical protein
VLNGLLYGDNLEVLREHEADRSVDLAIWFLLFNSIAIKMLSLEGARRFTGEIAYSTIASSPRQAMSGVCGAEWAMGPVARARWGLVRTTACRQPRLPS